MRALQRGSAAALHAAKLDEPLAWDSPAGRAALSAATAVLSAPLQHAASSLRLLELRGLVDSERVTRCGLVVACNISDVTVTGLDTLLARAELAPDGGPLLSLTSALGRLRASARVSAELRVALGGRASRPLVHSRFEVVAHLSRVRLATRWHCTVRASSLLASPPAALRAAAGERARPVADSAWLRALRPRIETVHAAVGDVVVELGRVRGEPLAQPPRPSPPLLVDWPRALARRLRTPDNGARLAPLSVGASRALVPWLRLDSRPPPADHALDARTPAFVWRAFSYVVSARLAVVIAREAEGALLWRLRALTEQPRGPALDCIG